MPELPYPSIDPKAIEPQHKDCKSEPNLGYCCTFSATEASIITSGEEMDKLTPNIKTTAINAVNGTTVKKNKLEDPRSPENIMTGVRWNPETAIVSDHNPYNGLTADKE